MQSVAAEMNLSETAFLLVEDHHYRLRWMTPTVEVDLCGHATLASAKYLFDKGLASTSKPIVFETRSGKLTATWKSGKISLDFPAIESAPMDPELRLQDALGIVPLRYFRGRFDLLIELASEDQVRGLKPDFRMLKQIPARGIVVTAQADEESEYDYICRGFFPQSGIDEDPVTGSAHCMLAPFWSERLGKNDLLGCQASSRGGLVRVVQLGDRVELIGDAVIVLHGELLI